MERYMPPSAQNTPQNSSEMNRVLSTLMPADRAASVPSHGPADQPQLCLYTVKTRSLPPGIHPT